MNGYMNTEEIAKNYRPCKELEGLYVDREGNVIYNGRKKSTIKFTNKYGRKTTARILLRIDGRTRYFSVARLVAHAFKLNYEDDCVITFLDGNIHNVCADNLKCVDKKAYYKRKMAIVLSHRKVGTLQGNIQKLETVIAESEAVLHYIRSGDFSKINEHVTKYLYQSLVSWCVSSRHKTIDTASDMVASTLTRMYEVIIAGYAITHMEHYCKKLLVNLDKEGWFGEQGYVHEPVKKIVDNLNLDCLCKKYKVKKLKQ